MQHPQRQYRQYLAEVRPRFRSICEDLRRNHRLRSLQLSVKTDDENDLVGEVLLEQKNDMTLEELTFRCENHGCQLTRPPHDICRFVETSPSLRKIHLVSSASKFYHHNHGLFQAIQNNPRIQFMRCELEDPTTIASFHAMLRHMTTVTRCLTNLHLTLTGKAISLEDEEIHELASVLAIENSSLEELTIAFWIRGDGTQNQQLASVFLDALPANHSMTTLQVVNAGDQHALCRLVKRTQRLHTLRIQNCSIWWLDLMEHLYENQHRTIHALHLEHLYIYEDDVRALVNMLRATKNQLRHFTFRYIDRLGPGANTGHLATELCKSIVVDSKLTSLAFIYDPVQGALLRIIPHEIPNLIRQNTWLEELELSVHKQDELNAIADAIAGHPTLKKIRLTQETFNNQTETPWISDLTSLTEGLPSSLSLECLTLADGFQLDRDGGASDLARYLASPTDRCRLRRLDLERCGITATGMATLLRDGVRCNRTLESLTLHPQVKKSVGDYFQDRSWGTVVAPAVVSSLQEHAMLKHVEIADLHPERDLNGLLAYCCTRNKCRSLFLGNSSWPCLEPSQEPPDQPLAVLPEAIESLLHRPGGVSGLMYFLRQKSLNVGIQGGNHPLKRQRSMMDPCDPASY